MGIIFSLQAAEHIARRFPDRQVIQYLLDLLVEAGQVCLVCLVCGTAVQAVKIAFRLYELAAALLLAFLERAALFLVPTAHAVQALQHSLPQMSYCLLQFFFEFRGSHILVCSLLPGAAVLSGGKSKVEAKLSNCSPFPVFLRSFIDIEKLYLLGRYRGQPMAVRYLRAAALRFMSNTSFLNHVDSLRLKISKPEIRAVFFVPAAAGGYHLSEVESF